MTRPPPHGAAQWALAAAAALLALLLFGLPLLTVFAGALGNGLVTVPRTLADPDVQAAIFLTVRVAAISVAINGCFGLLAAWCLTKHDFPGRALLAVLVELPLGVSPVISGLVWVLLMSSHGWFGPVLDGAGIHVVFATPGIVLATLFVTFPYVVRPLLPLMAEQGRETEEAAVLLGANWWQIFRRVTLPEVRWALLSGVLLCNARAMGEFGAVSVVSGHIPGLTETMPLEVEALYNGYQSAAAFTVAALLACLGLLTLGAKAALERLTRRPAAPP